MPVMAQNTTFGPLLIEIRERHGFSSTNSLAEATDIDQSQLSKIERGKLMPSTGIIDKLAKVFDQQEISRLQTARVHDLLGKKGLRDYILQDDDGNPITELLPKQNWTAVPSHWASKLKTGRDIADAPKIEKAGGLQPEPLPALGKLTRIPIYEDVACGWGGVATENPVDWEEWPERITGGGDHAIRVRGGSMRDVGIEDGTLVFVKRYTGPAKKIPSGKKVIAHLGDDHYTCKVLIHDRHVSWLQGAADGFFKPIYLHEDPKPRIVGIVTGYHKLET